MLCIFRSQLHGVTSFNEAFREQRRFTFLSYVIKLIVFLSILIIYCGTEHDQDSNLWRVNNLRGL